MITVLILCLNFFKTQVKTKYRCLWNTNAPLPQLIKNRVDLWPWPFTYWPKFLLGVIYSSRTFYFVWSFWGKAFFTYRLHKVLETDLTFDLDLMTWKSIGIIYSSRTIYLPSLKLLGQSVLELSVAQGVGYKHDLDLWPSDLNIKRDHLLIVD